MRKGEKMSDEQKEKIGNANRGKIRSEDTRKKISEIKKGNKNRLGKTFSEESREKMKKSHLGQKSWNKGLKMSKEFCEKCKSHKMPNNIGIVRSEEYRRKSSELHKGLMVGENHPNWKGGVTPEVMKIRNSLESKLWREAVFKRDNYTCSKTNIKGGILAVHHVLNFSQFPELRFDVNNGITLSKEAHIEFHKIYGKKDNNKEQIEEFLGRRLEQQKTASQ
jgi:hypothetical protein